MLQYKNIAARPRCGFGAYFMPSHYEDHWVCEYWNENEQRWVLVDAQMDELQTNVLELRFHPLDVPRDRNGTFEPLLVPKRKRRIGNFDDLIISITATPSP